MTGALPLDTVRTVADLRDRVRDWRKAGLRIGLVPTMGALHAGHVELVKRAVAGCDRTVVTLFVNPAQFGPSEDYAVYPRDEVRDAALVAAEGAGLLFAPGVEEVYPEGHSTKVHVGGLGDVLEGEFRPGFFTGVATVVTKLLLQSLPDEAFFGEKDYQQLQVIKKLIRDLDIPVTATGVPTVREADGLALSSRNAYLTAEERVQAPILHGTLAQVAEQVGRGVDPRMQEEWARGQLARAGFRQVDYVTVRDASTLEEAADASRPARVLAAAWLGKARLIDNVAV
ncbi:MAG: pantoate--beta-alanine ligase [Rhodospirillales bacterium CG15_BIG_FIL_POST_REV_8_21_14_020_66_15]|nr:MAG: pantoate--beta-alanine ligase [Rhodospirillales bacterium CG15_BIG_FIL_POST_REV_8_21_14_020_66_15]